MKKCSAKIHSLPTTVEGPVQTSLNFGDTGQLQAKLNFSEHKNFDFRKPGSAGAGAPTQSQPSSQPSTSQTPNGATPGGQRSGVKAPKGAGASQQQPPNPVTGNDDTDK